MNRSNCRGSWEKDPELFCVTTLLQQVCDSLPPTVRPERCPLLAPQSECRATPWLGCNLPPLSSSSTSLTHRSAHNIQPTELEASVPLWMLQFWCWWALINSIYASGLIAGAEINSLDRHLWDWAKPKYMAVAWTVTSNHDMFRVILFSERVEMLADYLVRPLDLPSSLSRS